MLWAGEDRSTKMIRCRYRRRATTLIEAQSQIVDGRDHQEHASSEPDAELREFQRFELRHDRALIAYDFTGWIVTGRDTVGIRGNPQTAAKPGLSLCVPRT